jgi:preprotein translocase subunit YajC
MAIDNRKRVLGLAACAVAMAVCVWAIRPALAQGQQPATEGTYKEAKNADEGKGAEKPAAEKKTEEKKETGKDKAPGGGMFGGMTPFFIIIGVFLLMYIFMGSSRRKRETKRREMLANVKKGDKVTSIGGICGTVADVREDEIIVKIDENSNTRLRLARWAVKGVGEEAKTEKPEDRK